MRKDAVAEWILGQVMNRSRAVAIMGDLSEANFAPNGCKFWFSIAGIVLASTWTWIVALAIGVLLAGWSVVFLNDQLIGQAISGWDLGPHRPHPFFMTPLWLTCLNGLAQLSTVLLLLSPYVVIRYGLKDKLTRVLLSSLVFIFGTTCLWWLPAALPICVTSGVAGIVACVWTRERRRALGIAFAVAVAGLLTSPVAAWLISLVHRPAFGCELQGCLAQTPALDASQLFLAIPVAVVCTFLHARLLESDPPYVQSADVQTT